MKLRKTTRLLLGLLLAAAPLPAAAQQTPVITDSRIKTLVYNENDVYSLLTHYGYQASIEFGPKERIETLSVGDRIGWQIIPAGRRIFIRPQEEGAHTNMTVITNLHTYQFDLASDQGGALRPEEALVYVVRFYYPNDDLPRPGATYASDIPVAPVGAGAGPGASAAGAPGGAAGYNYRYTYTGDPALAPRKIYDDGRSTYFALSAPPVSAASVGPDGRESPVALENAGGGLYRASLVTRRFVLRYGAPGPSVPDTSGMPAGAGRAAKAPSGGASGTICVFNEAF